MNTELRFEITKVEPCMTAGKDEAPKRFIKVKLSRGFDHDLAAELKATQTRSMLLDGELRKATIDIAALTVRATFNGLGRGVRQGTIAIVLSGVKAIGTAPKGEDGDLSVDLVFNAEYSDAAMVFLGDNVRNTVDVKLEDVQPSLPAGGQQESVADDGWAKVMPADDPTEPQDPPKKRGRRKLKSAEAATGNA